MTPDHDELASLRAMKELLRRYVAERSGDDPARLAADLREVCDFLLAEAGRQGISLDDVVRQYREAITKTARMARKDAGPVTRRRPPKA